MTMNNNTLFIKEKAQYFLRKIFWNLQSFTWDDFLDSTGYGKEIEEIASFAADNKLTEQPKLLDLGCATGSYSIVLAQKQFSVTGIDYAVKMIHAAEKKASASGISNVSFQVSDFNRGLNFQTAYFDFVLSAHTLEGIADISGFITEIKRVLKPGGSFLLVVKKKKTIKTIKKRNFKTFLAYLIRLSRGVVFSGTRNFSRDIDGLLSKIESLELTVHKRMETLYNYVILFRKVDR